MSLEPSTSPNKGHFTHETESPWPIHFKHSHWWKRRSPSKFTSHYAWGTNGVYICTEWCKMDVQSAWILTYHRNGSCFMVTWDCFRNYLLEVGLTQNQETTVLRTLTTIDLFYFYYVWGPAWSVIHWNSIWLRARSHMTSHYTGGSVTTQHDFGTCIGMAFGHFLLGSHNFVGTALGSCVKWPLLKASPMTLHLRSYIRDADADAWYWPSRHGIIQIKCGWIVLQEVQNSLHFVKLCMEVAIS